MYLESTITQENVKTEISNEINHLAELAKAYLPGVLNFIINIIVALVIFYVGKLVIKAILKIANKFFEKTSLEISVTKFLLSVMRILLYLVLIIIICGKVGIETTSFITVLGSAGLAIGLALQGSLSNFAGGVLILLLHPFKIGDYIVESNTGKEGTVKKIDVFYTSLVTGDNKLITIPNGALANTTIINASAFDTRRISIPVGISYNDDVSKAKEVLERIANEHPLILKDKPISANVHALADSSVAMELRFWVKSENYWDVFFEVNTKVKEELDANGIEIPYNQLVVHMKKD